jgi:hypothetical protein
LVDSIAQELPKDADEEVVRVFNNRFGASSKYLELRRADGYEGYDDMESFIDGLTDVRLRGRLEEAIRGRGAFRRFRAIINDSVVCDEWFAFKARRSRERIEKFLELNGVRPTPPPGKGHSTV